MTSKINITKLNSLTIYNSFFIKDNFKKKSSIYQYFLIIFIYLLLLLLFYFQLQQQILNLISHVKYQIHHH